MAQGYLGKSRRPPKSRGENREADRGNAQGRAEAGRWDNLKGEGNYKAAREFDEAERKFVQSGKVDEAVSNAPPASEAEKREMEDAEERARQRAKEEDPALLKRPPTKPQRKR
jgi:hypothetical protein